MKGKRYSEEQIIGILKEHEAGMPAQDVIRKHCLACGVFQSVDAISRNTSLSEMSRKRAD